MRLRYKIKQTKSLEIWLKVLLRKIQLQMEFTLVNIIHTTKMLNITQLLVIDDKSILQSH